MDAAVAAAEEAHRQELTTIKASALVNLAYLHLQQQQWQQAVAYCEQILKVMASARRVDVPANATTAVAASCDM